MVWRTRSIINPRRIGQWLVTDMCCVPRTSIYAHFVYPYMITTYIYVHEWIQFCHNSFFWALNSKTWEPDSVFFWFYGCAKTCHRKSTLLSFDRVLATEICHSSSEVRGGPLVSVLDWQSSGSGFKPRPGEKLNSRCSVHHAHTHTLLNDLLSIIVSSALGRDLVKPNRVFGSSPITFEQLLVCLGNNYSNIIISLRRFWMMITAGFTAIVPNLSNFPCNKRYLTWLIPQRVFVHCELT